MLKLYWQVKEFMQAAQQVFRKTPGLPSRETIALGVDLVEEEWQETKDAMAHCRGTQMNGEDADVSCEALAKVADGLADLLYVVTWNCLAWGIPIAEVIEEVHRSNMTKFPVQKDETGKVKKPPHYSPPDIVGTLRGWMKNA